MASHKPKVVFLESITGIETLFIRGLRFGAQEAGWDVSVRFLRNKDESHFTTDDIRSALKAEKPDLICFLMDAPLLWDDLWEDAVLQKIPKISVWFDDFLRSPHTLENPQTWTRWQNERNVKVLIWDGHWRRKWKEFTQCEALPIHLAADRGQFDPQASALFHELHEFVIMAGTIPSMESLEGEKNALPTSIQKTIQECMCMLETDPWPIRPYQRMESVVEQLPDKHRIFVQQWLAQPLHQALLNHLIWRWGKRIARLRGLKAIAESSPVAVLSGHRTESFARGEEIAMALGENTRFEFRDTTDVLPLQWSGIFQSGKLQVQITDPQSIEGGIPFRVFECAACEVPLLSDHRSELEELFPQSPLASDETELAQKAAVLGRENFHESISEIKKLFEKWHTWEQRWKQIVDICLKP